MVYTDPYSPERTRYECHDCATRVETTDHPGACPDCDGELANLVVPRN